MHATIGSEISRKRARELVERVRSRHVRSRRSRQTRNAVPRFPAT